MFSLRLKFVSSGVDLREKMSLLKSFYRITFKLLGTFLNVLLSELSDMHFLNSFLALQINRLVPI